MLAKINGTDITKWINTSSYEVNAEDVMNTWEDANKVTHRDIIRQRVKGKFSLSFSNISECEEFVELIKANRLPDKRILMTLKVLNENEERTLYVFFKFLPTLFKNRANGKHWNKLTFEVEEP